jgi:hypothetical protein
MAMVGSGESEPLHTSLAGVARGATALWVDGTAKDLAALREFTALEALRIYKLPRRHVPVLAGCPLPRLTSLSVRHAEAEDLGFLAGFVMLETLSVWQSPKVTRLDGIERLTRLATLALSDIGAIESLTPLMALPGLRSLALAGGVWSTQELPSLAPLRALESLEQLNLTAAKAIDGDLGPLCGLSHLTQLELSPRNFEPAQIARVAAAHPFFRRELLALRDFDTWDNAPGCKKCKSRRKILFLRRKKLLWCPRCEGEKLAALVADFERLVEEKRREREAGAPGADP